MWVGLLTGKIGNNLEKGNLIYEHALNREPVPLIEDLRWYHDHVGQVNILLN